ncbi:MAG: hypothetical protein JWQ35_858 [Bacteriovoracaceae bacterium]|nr:hypothetical protein [Bacteriovoracaceae bacterium]
MRKTALLFILFFPSSFLSAQEQPKFWIRPIDNAETRLYAPISGSNQPVFKTVDFFIRRIEPTNADHKNSASLLELRPVLRIKTDLKHRILGYEFPEDRYFPKDHEGRFYLIRWQKLKDSPPGTPPLLILPSNANEFYGVVNLPNKIIPANASSEAIVLLGIKENELILKGMGIYDQLQHLSER